MAGGDFEAAFKNAAARHGWAPHTQAEVLLGYVREVSHFSDFTAYLSEAAAAGSEPTTPVACRTHDRSGQDCPQRAGKAGGNEVEAFPVVAR